MRILFLLTSEFPAEKAYGITTKKSMLACQKLGHEVLSISLPVVGVDEENKELLGMIRHFEKNKLIRVLLKISYSGYGKFSVLAWILMEKFLLKKNLRNIENLVPNILWCRDFKIALFLLKKFPDLNLILEIHNLISLKKIIKIQKNINTKKLILAPINTIILNHILSQKSDLKLVEAPMSIDSHLLQNELEVGSFIERFEERKANNQLSLGYVGKFFPSGFSKGYEDVINLALHNKNNQLNYKIFLVGGTLREVAHASNLIQDLGMNNSDLHLGEHMPHDEILEFSKSLDVIILPKPRDPNYVGTPLKALENCALGRVIVAADCMVNRALFEDKGFVFWYEAENVSSLVSAVESATNDKLLNLKILEEIQFARLHTWEKRVEQVLDTLV